MPTQGTKDDNFFARSAVNETADAYFEGGFSAASGHECWFRPMSASKKRIRLRKVSRGQNPLVAVKVGYRAAKWADEGRLRVRDCRMAAREKGREGRNGKSGSGDAPKRSAIGATEPARASARIFADGAANVRSGGKPTYGHLPGAIERGLRLSCEGQLQGRPGVLPAHGPQASRHHHR